MQFRIESTKDEWKKAAAEIDGTIYGAARAAFQDLADRVQAQARSAISASGLTGKWVTGFRTYIFPRIPSQTTELTMRGFHSYNIANVFERGANIAGKPLLWIPLPTAPAKVGGKQTTAARLIAAGVRLHRVRGSGHQLLIGSVIRSTPSLKRRFVTRLPGGRLFVSSAQVTVGQLLNGQRNVRRSQVRGAFGARGPQSVSIPLFVGLSSVQIRAKFNISAIYDRGRLDLPILYDAQIIRLGKRLSS